MKKVGLFLLFLYLFPQGAKSKPFINDTILVNVINNQKENSLFAVDFFGENISLISGRHSFLGSSYLYNGKYNTQAIYFIDKSIGKMNLEFSQISNDDFFYLIHQDKKKYLELNFDVFFNKNIAPIKNINDFLEFKTFSKPEYLKDLSLRDKKIDDFFNKKVQFLHDFYQKNELSASFLNNWTKIILFDRLLTKIYFDKSFENSNLNHLRTIKEIIESKIKEEVFLDFHVYKALCNKYLELLEYLEYGKVENNYAIKKNLIESNFSENQDLKNYLLFTIFNKFYSEINFFKESDLKRDFELFLKEKNNMIYNDFFNKRNISYLFNTKEDLINLKKETFF